MSAYKTLTIACLFVVLVLACCFIGLMISGINSIEESSLETIIDLGYNWGSGPIKIIQSGADCAAKYPVINTRWPGTTPGCQCLSVTRGFCSRGKNSYQNFCTDIMPIKPVDYRVWDGINICKDQYIENYLELNLVGGNCPSGTKSCGRADSLENNLCIPNSSDCPINDIKFISKSQPTPLGYNELNFFSSKMIFRNSNTNGNIAIQFRIEDGTPCSDPHEVNSRSSNYVLDYYFLNNQCKVSIDGSLYDPSYTQLSSTNLRSLLDQNNITPLLQNLKDYPINQLNIDTYLYVKPYIGFKTECKAKLLRTIENKPADFIDNLTKIGLTANEASGLGSTLFSLVIATYIVVMITVIFDIVSKIMCIEVTFVGRSCYNIFFWTISSMVLLIIIMGYSSAISDKLANLGNAHLLLEGCMDRRFEELIKKFSLNIEKAKSLITAGAIISAICLVFLILEIIFWRCSMSFHLIMDNNIGGQDDQVVGNGENNNDREMQISNMNNYLRHLKQQANVDVRLDNSHINNRSANYEEVNVQVDVNVEDDNFNKEGTIEYDDGIEKKNTMGYSGTADIKLNKGESVYRTPSVYDQENQQDLPPPIVSANTKYQGSANANTNYQGSANSNTNYQGSANADFQGTKSANANADFKGIKSVNANADFQGSDSADNNVDFQDIEGADANVDVDLQVDVDLNAQGQANYGYGYGLESETKLNQAKNINAGAKVVANAEVNAGIEIKPPSANVQFNAGFNFGS